LESLLRQEFKDFEIVVVDQNRDDRILPVLERYQSSLNISRIPTPGRHGVSSARNDGWRRVDGDIILFPDDDCWYPPWFLRRGVELLDTTGAELVSGRSVDETGRSINGRFASRAQFITRRSVWTAQSEWVSFYRRELLERLGGFDEQLGIGNAKLITPRSCPRPAPGKLENGYYSRQFEINVVALTGRRAHFNWLPQIAAV
jgi:glycosyltransferase involved in cell wall biosynthesis